MKKKFVLGNCY